ncbi:hypothetical protein EES45_36125 [Streptomyces sp. ADI97-07]|uniref:hypothetical protein n=1 Tax=Streptomyces sp. ADI97-07 TaxID=1522762 RepID=UPI000F550B3B|nr:hypothetical protein [Streptomyces sp. ADI97-07]RPK70068.1 hypothetical protein EES45_36125 [Streptomyces sp. ADI97-07]
MIKVLILIQYASRLSRRTLALAIAGIATTGVVAASIFWAPVERAELVVSFISPVLAALVAGVGIEWWKRRRS